MAGQTLILSYAEGTNTLAPIQNFINASQVAAFADVAAFESAKGSASAESDFFLNTTSGRLQYYTTSWKEIQNIDELKVLVNASGNQAAADGLTGLEVEMSDATNVALTYDSTLVSRWKAGDLGAESEVMTVGTAQTVSGVKTHSSNIIVSDTTSSTDKDTGSIVTEGGVGIEENLNVGGNATIEGDLTVNGTTTTVNSATLEVTDANITVNDGGTEASADLADAGLTVEMSDATDAVVGFDSTLTSKWKAGESGDLREVATVSHAQQLTNKDYEGGTASNTSRMTVPKADTATLDGLTRKEATIVFDSTTKEFKGDDGTTLGSLGGSGAGKKNYCPNGEFENNINGVTSTDASLVVSHETGSPLSGLGSLKVVGTTVVVDSQIEIVLDEFDDTDQASIIQNQFAYSYDGPEDTILIGLYDNTNSKLIQGSLSYLEAGTFRTHNSFVQTAYDSTDYTLVMIDKVGGSSYTLYVDRLVTTPDVVSGGQGALGARYTTNTGQSVGDGAYEKVLYPTKDYDTHGSMDSSIFTAKRSDYYIVSASATWTNINLSAGSAYNLKLVKNSATVPVDLKFSQNEANAANSSNNDSMNITDIVYLKEGETLEVQVFQNTGASRNISGVDERTVFSISSIGGGARISSLGGEILSEIDYRGNGGQSITAGVTDISFATPFNVDKLGEWDGNGFVAKTTKTYIFSGLALFTTALNADLNSYIGGVFDRTVNTAHGIAEQGKNFICIVKLQAGERWSLRSGASGTLSNNNNVHYINVNALAETSNGIAPEQVKLNEKARNTLGQSIGSGSGGSETLVWDTAEHSSHGALNLSTGVFTAPYSGYFNFSGQFIWNGDAAFTAGRLTWAYFRKDGISKTFQGFKEIQSSDAGTIFVTVQFDEDIYLEKDQTLEIAPYQNTGADRDIVANGEYNVLQIKDA